MSHRLLHDASFWLVLLAVDQDLARTEHERGFRCGARLHRADRPRKPRGVSIDTASAVAYLAVGSRIVAPLPRGQFDARYTEGLT